MIDSTTACFLRMLVEGSKARTVLELGTFTGYSAMAMAEGLLNNFVKQKRKSLLAPKLITCERDKKMAEIALQNVISHHEIAQIVSIIEGEASITLQKLKDEEHVFDFIFIDADKSNYSLYYNFIMNNHMLSKDGLMVVDNVLWNGRVVQNELELSDPKRVHAEYKTVSHIIAFNTLVSTDPRVNTLMLPIRDGLMLVWHKN